MTIWEFNWLCAVVLVYTLGQYLRYTILQKLWERRHRKEHGQ